MTEWRPVRGYLGMYDVSDTGEVRSLDRVVIRSDGAALSLMGCLLRTKLVGNGYPAVTLSRESKGDQRYVHHLVAEAFIGQRPEGQQVNHRNGIKVDNRASNLEYLTPQQNMKHGADVLGHGRGENNAGARLTEEKVRAILDQRGQGSHREIANRFSCSPQVVQAILAGKSWKHITAKGAA